MKKELLLSSLIVVATVLAPVAQAQNLLANAGFESALGNGTGNWGAFGNAFQSGGGPTPYAGAGELKIFGAFNGGNGTDGVFQNFAASAGQIFNASAYGQNWSGDAMQAGNEAFMRVTFFNSSNQELAGGMDSANIDLNTPQNTWTALSITGIVAPTGTAYGQAFFLFNQGVPNNGGSAWFDNASVQAAPEPFSIAILGMGALGLIKRRRA